MDSVNGQAVWSVSLGLTLESGPEVAVEGMWLVREVGEGVNPTLAIIVTRKRKEGVETVGFHLDAFTGEVSGEVDEHTRMPLGKVLFTGKPETAFLTPFENCGTQNKVLAVVDSSHMVSCLDRVMLTFRHTSSLRATRLRETLLPCPRGYSSPP